MTSLSKLPDKPSELIRVAIADLEKCEASADYGIEMGDWHMPARLNGGQCTVCLAGATMAQTLGADANDPHWPCEFEADEEKLHALDSFRLGCAWSGLDCMGLYCPEVDECEIAEYGLNPGKFKSDMYGLAERLAEVGL